MRFGPLTARSRAFVAAALIFFGAATAPRAMAAAAPQAFVPSLRVGDSVPDEPLIDQFGSRLSLRSAESPAILSFFDTRCSDARMCPLVTAKFARLQRLLATTKIRLIELTLDPEFDRPNVLRRYAEAAGARAGAWYFGTGPAPDVLALSERFGILSERAPGGRLGHSESVAILSAGGVVMAQIDGNDWSPDDLAAEAREAAGLAANPLRRIALQLFSRVSEACGGRGAGGVSILGALAIFFGLSGVYGSLCLLNVSRASARRS